MGKRQGAAGLVRLAGKRLVFSGKFGYGVEDSLKAMATAQQGKVADDLDAKTDYLVLADANAGKAIQKKAVALNGKGATIQVIDADGFRKLAEPTEAEILELLRSGRSEIYAKLSGSVHYPVPGKPVKITYHAEDLNSAKLRKVHFDEIGFDGCSFVGARLEHTHFAAAADCDFSKSACTSVGFGAASRCKFHKAALARGYFAGDFSGADFSAATLAAC
jgi:hypothetical protein